MTFQTLELRAVSQVKFFVRVFHGSLSVLALLFHVFQDAKPFLLLLFQVCCCHLQALTGAFSQLPPKTPIVPKRLTFPPWAPIKIYYSFPIVVTVIGALALCLVELVMGFPLLFIITDTLLKMARLKIPNHICIYLEDSNNILMRL